MDHRMRMRLLTKGDKEWVLARLKRLREEIERLEWEFEQILGLQLRAHSAREVLFNHKGERLMGQPVTIHVTDPGVVASLVEFTGPNGTGVVVPDIGPVTHTSSDPTIAAVQADGVTIVPIAQGSVTIVGLDAGNNLTDSTVLNVVAAPATSAVETLTPIAAPPPATTSPAIPAAAPAAAKS